MLMGNSIKMLPEIWWKRATERRRTATNQRRVSKSDDSFIGDKARRHGCTNS
jgi:hypothetical protein